MPENQIDRISASPRFQELVAKRTRLTWTLTAVVFGIYFTYVLVIAFAPSVLAVPIGGGVTTIGIPVGILIILAAFLLTGLYVKRANSEFDALTDKLIQETE